SAIGAAARAGAAADADADADPDAATAGLGAGAAGRSVAEPAEAVAACAFWSAAPDPPDVSITAMTAPTGAVAPAANLIDAIFPLAGAVISTVALSVITSTKGSFSLTVWPSCTCQR